jgi:hypothetical protein
MHACQAFVDEVTQAHAGRLWVPSIELIHTVLKIDDRLGQPLNGLRDCALLNTNGGESEH